MTPENSRKKILLITRPIAPPWDEASKNFAYYLARNLDMFEMHLLTKGILPELGKNIVQHPIYTSSQNDFTFSQKLRSLFFQWQNRNAFAVAHHFFTPAKLNSFFLKNFLKSKKTKTIQTVATLREDLYSGQDITKLMFGDLIVTYSDYAKDKLNALGFGNVKRVSPGIDLEKYQPHEKNQILLDKYGFNRNDFIINFTGEYARLGVIDDVIGSFISISEKIPSAKLHLAVRIKNSRDYVKKEEVKNKLKENNLLNRVAFYDEYNYDGEDDKKLSMADTYNLCDISLFPVQNMRGKFDVPLAVVEAMACEKPVILSNLPILAELSNGQNSAIIEKGDQAQLVSAIYDLYGSPEKRASIGREARKFVEEKFDIKKIAEIYKEIYEKL
jgi:glycosyltransferase involved in cell wall biosynthesis